MRVSAKNASSSLDSNCRRTAFDNASLRLMGLRSASYAAIWSLSSWLTSAIFSARSSSRLA